MEFLTLLPLIGALDTSGGTTAPGGQFMSFLPFILIIGIFYFLIIRPQNKKQKETQKMLSALKKGDKVVTIGGVHGTISSVKETTVVVKVDDNVKLEFSRSAISNVVAVSGEKEEKPEKEEKSTKKIEDKSEEKTETDTEKDKAEEKTE
jgi:preprotein translocase subunit YajC